MKIAHLGVDKHIRSFVNTMVIYTNKSIVFNWYSFEYSFKKIPATENFVWVENTLYWRSLYQPYT